MTVVADTGGLYALFDADDRHHAAARATIDREPGPIIVPAGILGEIDYLLREFLGIDAELSFLENLISGAFTLETSTAEDLVRVRGLIDQYRDLDLGLADASVIATAERLGIQRILTVDERDFRVVRPKNGQPFTLLPADA
ncbi:MAG: PIN domain-containing protein [bacterium]|nr:PIN domain-containing protein [bacterium]